MHPMLNTAIKAARKAGSIINRASLDLDLIRVSNKGRSDFVTEVDKAAEQAILEIVSKAYPDHASLPKNPVLPENPNTRGSSTRSMARPTSFTASRSTRSRSRSGIASTSQAVVYDPTRNELFAATRGRGAFMNERRLRVSKRERLADCLIGTGFPFRALEHLDEYVQMFRSITEATAGIRRPGAAALDLAYVAAGRLDGFWEIGLSPWDMAAGSLLILEAGGLVSNFQGDPGFMEDSRIVCASPKIFPQLLKLVGGVHGTRKAAGPRDSDQAAL